jgi:hypothetical protein
MMVKRLQIGNLTTLRSSGKGGFQLQTCEPILFCVRHFAGAGLHLLELFCHVSKPGPSRCRLQVAQADVRQRCGLSQHLGRRFLLTEF